MKSEKLYEAISEIDEKLIYEAENFSVKKRIRKMPVIMSAAAAVIIVAALGIMQSTGFLSGNVITAETTTLPEEITGMPVTEEPLPSAYQENTTSGFPENNSEETTSAGIPETTVCVLPPPSEVTTDSFSNPHKDSGREIRPVALATASYPKRAAYPLLGELDPRYDSWREDRREIWGIEVETDNVDSFSKSVMSGLLTDRKDENNIVSPFNLFMALSMLSEACDGNSRQQILEVLGAESIEALREQANKIWQKNYRNDGAVKSVTANSLWLNDTIVYNKSAVKNIAEKYYASVFIGTMGSQKYDKLLNDWISDNTDGMLKPALEMHPDTVMSIASTILFTSKWSDEFQKSATEKGTFHAPSGDKTVSFMKATRDMYYFWGEKYCAVSLGLNIGGQMWFILPDEGVDADEIFSDTQMLDLVTRANTYSDTYGDGKFIEVHMSIPKFDVKSERNVLDGLKKLGITDVTDELLSDFSPLAANPEGIFIDEISHGVRVKIDEEGVQAAAYTVIRGAGSPAPPDDEVDFVVDRPFAFVITSDNNIPLFAGVVNNP